MRVIKYVDAVQKMTELFAFGEFWRRLSHLGKFNTCQWHSACTKFGHSNIFATLSLRYSPTVAHTLLRFAGTRGNIRLSLQKCKGGLLVFSPFSGNYL